MEITYNFTNLVENVETGADHNIIFLNFFNWFPEGDTLCGKCDSVF